METLAEEALDYVLLDTFHNLQRVIRSVLYTLVEQVMIDLLGKDVTGERLDARVMNIFDLYEAAEKLSGGLLISTFYSANCDFC